MAQIIKHRRGSIASIGSISVNAGELIIGSGSFGTLSGPIAFIGDPASSTYKPIPQIFSGSTVPTVTSSYFNGISFYATSDKNLYILQSGSNLRLDLAGAVSGSPITPSSITTAGNISASAMYLSSTLTVVGLTTEGNVSASNIYASNNITATSISASYGYFAVASGSFSGSFTGSFTGTASFATSASFASTASYVNTLNQNVVVSGSVAVTGGVNHAGAYTGPYVDGLIADYVTGNGRISVGYQDNFTVYTSGSGGTAILTVTSASGVTATSFTGSFSGSGAAITGVISASYAASASNAISGAYAVNATSASFASTASYVNTLFQTVTITGSLNAQTASFGTLSTTGNVTIGGNLTVNGGTTIVSSSVVDIGTSTILLNYNAAANQAAGIYAIDNTAPTLGTGSLLYDPVNNYWVAGLSGSEQRVVRQATGTQLTAYALAYTDAASGSLVSLPTPTTPTATVGDAFPVFVTGSNTWYMTNTIDGGTF
jgi:hypothetical protein